MTFSKITFTKTDITSEIGKIVDEIDLKEE